MSRETHCWILTYSKDNRIQGFTDYCIKETLKEWSKSLYEPALLWHQNWIKMQSKKKIITQSLWSNSQQNICKVNLRATVRRLFADLDQVGFIPEMKGWFSICK